MDENEIAAQIDGRVAYGEFLAQAEALPADQIKPLKRFDATLASNNIAIGVKVAYKHQEQIPGDLSNLSLAGMLALPRLGAAVVYAEMKAEQVSPAATDVTAMLREASGLRSPMLDSLRALVRTNLVPKAELNKIVKGTGARDRGQDCLDLSRVFTQYGPAIAGKHPISPEMIDRASVVGTWVVQNVKARGARKDTATVRPEVELHDRMITLLINQYQELRTVGYYYYGDDFNTYVPKLQSRYIRPRTKPSDDE